MSDDTKPDGTEKEPTPTKTYSEEEFKKAVAERDKAKAKVREIEDRDKKALEDKAIEEGKLKDVLSQKEAKLAELQAKIDAADAVRQERRAKALEKVTDPVMRKVAEKLTDDVEIAEFIAALEERKITTHNANDKKTAPEAPAYKSIREMRQAQEGGGLIPNLR